MEDIAGWSERVLGHRPKDPSLFERALTHSSRADAEDYERLEFLGDRILGLAIAEWVYELFPEEPEGKLSRRLNSLVDRETCADVARQLGLGARVRLGKQARDDGASDSDNVLGDLVEALLGALYLDAGLETAVAFVRRCWAERVTDQGKAPKHPKSALQEWSAANERKPPVYTLAHRSGPHHAPRFRVDVEIPGVGTASAEGTTKQEAETEAAKALLEQLT